MIPDSIGNATIQPGCCPVNRDLAPVGRPGHLAPLECKFAGENSELSKNVAIYCGLSLRFFCFRSVVCIGKLRPVSGSTMVLKINFLFILCLEFSKLS